MQKKEFQIGYWSGTAGGESAIDARIRNLSVGIKACLLCLLSAFRLFVCWFFVYLMVWWLVVYLLGWWACYLMVYLLHIYLQVRLLCNAQCASTWWWSTCWPALHPLARLAHRPALYSYLKSNSHLYRKRKQTKWKTAFFFHSYHCHPVASSYLVNSRKESKESEEPKELKECVFTFQSKPLTCYCCKLTQLGHL